MSNDRRTGLIGNAHVKRRPPAADATIAAVVVFAAGVDRISQHASESTVAPLDPPPLCAACSGPWTWRRVGELARLFGPAAMVASVSIGAGETIIVVRTGAWFRYDLLWLVLLAVLAKGVCVTYLLGRYTAITGEPLNQRLVRLPGPRGWLPLSITFLELAAAGPLWAAIARPCGELLAYLFLPGEAATIWAPWLGMGFVVVAVAVGWGLSFERLERQQVAICSLLVVGTAVGVLMVRPDAGAMLRGFLSFGYIPEFPDWAPEAARAAPRLTLATTFGYVGGTVLGYVVYANWISMHGWGMTGHPRHAELVRRAAAGHPRDYLPDDRSRTEAILASIAPLKWDVGFGAVVLLLVTTAFLAAGAAVLAPRLESGELEGAFAGWSLLTDQASIWHNIHPQLVWVYYACVLLGLWGTLQAFPEIYSRVTVDVLRAWRPERAWSRGVIHGVLCLYVVASAGAVLASGKGFDSLTHVVAFLTTNLAVTFAMVAALLLNFQLPRPYRTRRW
ncbi:MAG: Nramp family divalent metal transporter, partial [Planctomycetales bacterium]|nr:Nramp family divalent metal transporter [Planctomycetales bacterium]